MAEPTTDAVLADTREEETAAAEAEALVEQELLVEDVSIDGMCGVY
jgi:mycofactocin precursor